MYLLAAMTGWVARWAVQQGLALNPVSQRELGTSRVRRRDLDLGFERERVAELAKAQVVELAAQIHLLRRVPLAALARRKAQLFLIVSQKPRENIRAGAGAADMAIAS